MREAGQKLTQPTVLQWFEKNGIGLPGHVTAIANETGLSPTQVSNAISHLRKTKPAAFEKIASGIYLYHGLSATVKNAGKRLFEELAVSKGGAIIAQDEDGNLYWVTEME